MKKYLFKFKFLLFLNLITIIASAFLGISIAYIIKIIVETGEARDMDRLASVVILCAIFLLGLSLSVFLRRLVHAKYLEKILVALKADIFEKIINMNIKTFKEENSANYISTLTNDIKILEDDYFDNVLQLIFQVVTFIIASIYLTVLSPIMTVIVFVLGVLPASIPLIFEKKLSALRKICSDNLSVFTVKVKDMLTGFEVIKSFHIVGKVKTDYASVNDKVEKSKFKFSLFNNLVNIVSELFGGALFIGIMLLGAYFVIIGRMTLGSMLAVTQLMNNVLNPILMLSEKMSKFKSVKAIEEKINDIKNIEEDGDEGLEKLELNTDIALALHKKYPVTNR